MASTGDFSRHDSEVPPEGREIEPRRGRLSDALLERLAGIAPEFVEIAKSAYRVAPIYLIERRAIQLRRARWQAATPSLGQSGEHEGNFPSAEDFSALEERYGRPPREEEASSNSTAEDKHHWLRRLFGLRRPQR